MSHYLKPNARKSSRVTIRFTPDEMDFIDGIMQALGRTNKAQFFHNTILSHTCRLREQLIKQQ